ncbi:MAG: short-chain dehydrogenase [Candidatus Sedimenticola sp. (ex Thyasira tokunagai)]
MNDDSIPTPVEFLLEVPLYTKITFVESDAWKIPDIMFYDRTYDNYCPTCNRDSTFKVLAQERPAGLVRNVKRDGMKRSQGISIPNYPILPIGIFHVYSECSRDNNHSQDFFFIIKITTKRDSEDKPIICHTLEKIGQHPSFGDLHLAKVKKYRTVLTKTQLGELSRGIGLASHDVGIGSYVYLRRVFESLIEEAHQAAITDGHWDEVAYTDSRMRDKIKLLQQHLPDFLVEHPGMYSLMSKGVHELSEQECLKHFETLRIGIELILDEKLEHKKKEEKKSAAKTALQKALSDVSN